MFNEGVASGVGQAKLVMQQNLRLHLHYLLLGVAEVRDLHTLLYGRWIDLLILAADEEASQRQQLQVLHRDAEVQFSAAQHAIEEECGVKKCLGFKSGPMEQLDQP